MLRAEIADLLGRIDQKKRINRQGTSKIADVLETKDAGVLPIIFWRPQNTSVPGHSYNMKEQFFHKEMMLYAHLEEILDCAENAFDAPLCLRPNFGTILIPAMFGLRYNVFDDAYPWLASHMTKENIIRYRLPDLDSVEMMQRAVEYIRYFIETVPDWIHIYLPDTQGPFDIAHLIVGDGLFYELYDDPDFVHGLMEICTEAYIRATAILKKAIGEETTQCFHGHALSRGIFMRNGGVRISEDSATLISPKQIDEYVIPYAERALDHFGGGFIHFCGRNQYLLDAFLKLEKVRAINFGNPEMYEFESTMEKFILSKKCYFGLWPRRSKEGLIDYISRMRGASDGGKRGLLLHFDEKMFLEYSPEEVLLAWNTGLRPVRFSG